MVFWTGILFLALSLTRFREKVVRAIPEPLKIGIQAGIGLFILVIGLKNLGLFGDPAPAFIALRPNPPELIAPAPLLLAALGVVLTLTLMRWKIAGALLVAILVITVAGWFVTSRGEPVTARPAAIVSLPPSVAPILMQVDWLYPFRHLEMVWIPILTLFFVDLFDSIGTLIGVSRRAKLVDSEGNLPRMPPGRERSPHSPSSP